MFGVATSAFLICLMAGLGPAMAQTPAQRLSAGPRSMPMAESREASKSAGDWPGTAGAGNLGIAFSIQAIRDLRPLRSPPPSHRLFLMTSRN